MTSFLANSHANHLTVRPGQHTTDLCVDPSARASWESAHPLYKARGDKGTVSTVKPAIRRMRYDCC